MRPGSLLAELYDTDPPGVFPAPIPCESGLDCTHHFDTIDVGVSNYPLGMCGSFAFNDARHNLAQNPDVSMVNPTTDELLAAISALAPPQSQENTDLLSLGSAASDALQPFNLTGTR